MSNKQELIAEFDRHVEILADKIEYLDKRITARNKEILFYFWVIILIGLVGIYATYKLWHFFIMLSQIAP